MPTATKTHHLSSVRIDEIYPLSVFYRITGLGRHALRQARRKGLKVCRIGGRAYVRGDDFNAFLSSLEESKDRT